MNRLGLAVLRDGKLIRIRVKDGLFDGEISGFVLDAQDRLWMGLRQGILGGSQGLAKICGRQDHEIRQHAL